MVRGQQKANNLSRVNSKLAPNAIHKEDRHTLHTLIFFVYCWGF